MIFFVREGKKFLFTLARQNVIGKFATVLRDKIEKYCDLEAENG